MIDDLSFNIEKCKENVENSTLRNKLIFQKQKFLHVSQFCIIPNWSSHPPTQSAHPSGIVDSGNWVSTEECSS